MKRGFSLKACLFGVALALVGGAAMATSPIYPNNGTINPATYTFTAASTGDLIGYFAGSGASYDEQVGLLGSPNGVGLGNHSSQIGEAFNFGHVTAGQVLTFFDQINTTHDTWYSDASMNSDGIQHIYSTNVVANQIYAGSPAGVYIGFEDLAGGGDANYFDDTFIFTNTIIGGAVPEPGVWALLITGFAGLGMMLRTRRRAAPTAA